MVLQSQAEAYLLRLAPGGGTAYGAAALHERGRLRRGPADFGGEDDLWEEARLAGKARRAVSKGAGALGSLVLAPLTCIPLSFFLYVHP
jgi:hypothetical protein